MNSRIQLFRKKKNEENSANSSDVQTKSGKGAKYSLQGNSMTEEEQRIVDEAKANGTFDASNPDIRYSLFGGNSGYVGYSMSKRAARAREEGRYPKTDFRKEYGVTAKSFDELVDAKIIASGVWHHTSKFGNETKFYHWDEDYYADIYEENKAVIDKLSRERKTDEIVSLFENHPLAHKAEYDNETERLVDDVNREYNDKIREVENEKRDKERAYNSAVFDALGQLTNVVKTNNGNLWFNASNGVGIQIDSAGNEVSMNYGGANGSKGALRYEARNELQTAIESVAKESNIESADATYYTDKVNQLNSERAERVAQLVEAREKEYTPEARYSLASDMARDAVMTALEGAGIDVEMATPEMVEDVLRARDGKLMNFANSKEEFNRRFELAERNFGIVAKGLNDAVLTIVKLDNHPFTGTLKEARRQAQTWANQNLQGKEFDMPNNGGKYKISKDAIKKYLDKSAIGESVNPFIHLSTLLKLTEVIANSVDVEIHPDYKKDSDNNRSPENGIKSKDMLVH